jgi:integrase/recombinase XerD
VRVVKERDGGIVRRVILFDDAGDEVSLVTRFLSHLADSGYSPNTLCAYAYDLRHLVSFLDQRGMTWSEFRPSIALEFLAYLRRVPSRRPAQRLDLTVATGEGRLLSAATVARMLAATSSFFEWAIAAEEYAGTDNPMQRGLISLWVGSRIGISRSWGLQAANSRCAARFACGCRSGCPGR